MKRLSVFIVFMIIYTSSLGQMTDVIGYLEFKKGVFVGESVNIEVKIYVKDSEVDTVRQNINQAGALRFDKRIKAEGLDKIFVELDIDDPKNWNVRHNPKLYDKEDSFFTIILERNSDIVFSTLNEANKKPYSEGLALYNDLLDRNIYETENQKLNIIRNKAQFQIKNNHNEEAWNTYLYGMSAVDFSKASKNEKTFIRESLDAFLRVGEYETANIFIDKISTDDDPNVNLANWGVISDTYTAIYKKNESVLSNSTIDELRENFKTITKSTGSVIYQQ